MQDLLPGYCKTYQTHPFWSTVSWDEMENGGDEGGRYESSKLNKTIFKFFLNCKVSVKNLTVMQTYITEEL